MKSNVRKVWSKRMLMYVLLAIIAAFCVISAVQYHSDMKAAYARLNAYNLKTINTEFGTMSYVDEGAGEPILISHGIPLEYFEIVFAWLNSNSLTAGKEIYLHCTSKMLEFL